MKPLACIVASITLGVGVAMAQSLDVDLSGTWALDPEHSDSYEPTTTREGTATRRAPVTRRGADSGDAPRMLNRETVSRARQALATAPQRFAVEQGDGMVTLTYDGGSPVVLPTTGESLETVWLDGLGIEISASVERDVLRIVRSRDGVTAVDTCTRDPGAPRLTVVTTIAGGMGGDATVRRVYDLDPGA